eukprot:CAMPEP_0170193850 /NCGR_PEP_ID=MMETSP0040_2-20121228/57895_1 /TAXON_ID=641309 /ORGANISM="Lotharella oceanica, Strain CCMP622" /LENGTH=63 /DNA_ID=CAMNT_0010442591 /DNA_START=36 /DNA_END=227 /DNA_ORIENTATION=+
MRADDHASSSGRANAPNGDRLLSQAGGPYAMMSSAARHPRHPSSSSPSSELSPGRDFDYRDSL